MVVCYHTHCYPYPSCCDDHICFFSTFVDYKTLNLSSFSLIETLLVLVDLGVSS